MAGTISPKYQTRTEEVSSGTGGEAGMAYDALENYGLAIAAGDDDRHEDPGAHGIHQPPVIRQKPYLCRRGIRPITGTAEKVKDPAKDPHDYLVREVTVTEPGYAFIFLSNENLSQVDVHFDDVTVSHTHSPIVAGADYYPFGLVMETREIDDEPYRYGYQGQFSEKDLSTGMQEFHARQYDGSLGRFLGVNPQRQFSPLYTGMGNNPVMMVDPDGELAWFVPIIIGAVIAWNSRRHTCF